MGRGLVAAICLLATSAHAQNYLIDWHTVDGGGGTSTGGAYTLNGTIGQPDPGVAAGGLYQLFGGFWPALLAAPPGEAPTLVLQWVSGDLTISWSPATPGFELQQADKLDSGSWSAGPAGNPVVVSPSAQARFFRLTRP
jgi:hypothetical protein